MFTTMLATWLFNLLALWAISAISTFMLGRLVKVNEGL